MYCNKCGKEVDIDSKFCGACGAPTDDYAVTDAQKTAPDMTLRDWLITKFILGLPVIGLFFAIIWFFSQEKPANSRTLYVRASVIYWLIVTVIGIVFWEQIIRLMWTIMY